MAVTIASALRSVTGLVGYAARIFALIYALLGVLGGLAIAAAAFAIAAQGSTVRGALAALLALALSVTLGFWASFHLSIFFAIARLVREAAIGRLVFDALFDRLLGVTADNPQGSLPSSRAVHGLSVKDLEARLHAAGRTILESEAVEASVPTAVRWLARKAQRLIVWAVVRVIVSQCTVGRTKDESIDLLRLRSRLGDQIDGFVVNRLREYVIRLAVALVLVTIVIAVLLASGIRQLPL